MKWIPVSEELPGSGTRVVFSWKSKYGYIQTSIGYYAGYLDLDAEYQWDGFGDLDADYFDYAEDDPDQQTPFVPEGWYEDGGADGDYCFSKTGVTHWMPLPESPKKEI
jgi:hypothetical protein